MVNSISKQFCRGGHDTFITGRNKGGGCTLCQRTTKKAWALSNPEKVKKSQKGWSVPNQYRQKDYSKKYNDKASTKEKVNARVKAKRLVDPLFKAAHYLRNRIWSALKANKWHKTAHFKDYIGCTQEELKIHLEKQFKPGMTWENHSKIGWHADHIIPLESASTVEELYKLCHYTNLQPLWATDNFHKSDKLPVLS